MTTLAEKIEAGRKELVALKDDLLKSTEALEAAPDEESLLAEVEEQTAQVEQKTTTLAALEKAEAALKERAKAVVDAPAQVHHVGDKNTGDIWLKQAVCRYLAHVERKSIDEVMDERYKGDKALHTVHDMQKSAVPIGTTFTAGFAQELVQTDIQGFIDLLVPTSVVAALSGRTTMLNFDGYDSITIPRRAARGAGNDMSGAFVGEGGAIPLGQLSLTSSKLSRFKMAVISTFTRELAERSTPSIEALIRQAILDDTSIALDKAFLDATGAVAGVRPAGILNGVTVGTANTTGGVASVTADMKTMLNAMTGAGLGSRPVLLVNSQDAMSVGLLQSSLGEFVFRDEVNSGRILGVEIIKSLNVTAGTVILVDASTLATAFDMTSFDVSDVATVVEANADGTAPTMADDGTGAAGTAGQVPRNAGIAVSEAGSAAATGPGGAMAAGATARSLWQTASIGVRAITPVSWGSLQTGGVQALKSLKW